MRLTLVLFATLATGCVSDIYLIDRQTVLEVESSGEWPELDKKFQDAGLQPGPVSLEKTRDSVAGRQIFTMTHGDDSTAK